jgi:serine/threonine protein kinase
MEKINSNDFDVPISKNYILKAKNKLGSGSFGDIFLGINIKTNEKIAIKLELKNIPIPKIKIESKIYSIIQGGSKNNI